MDDMQDNDIPVIKPRENGPLRVDGLRHLIDAEGTPISTDGRGKGNIALCRCGQSGIKPFCDGTHRTTGFCSTPSVDGEASGSAESPGDGLVPGGDEARAAEEGGRRRSKRPPMIRITSAGPYLVCGGVHLEIGDDEWPRGASRERYALCRCGHSGSKPFCDGTHRDTAFDDRGLDTTGGGTRA